MKVLTSNTSTYSDVNKSKQTFLSKLYFSNQATEEWSLEMPSVFYPVGQLLAVHALSWAVSEGLSVILRFRPEEP